MASNNDPESPVPQPEPPPPGYQPSPGRKLLMFLLCVFGLILVWGYYWYVTK